MTSHTEICLKEGVPVSVSRPPTRALSYLEIA